MKKTKYLVAALLLMGATTTFTSCIDNDEPAGIEELRGAKAELIKAKAQIALAQEAWVRSQVALQEVEKQMQEIEVEYRKIDLEIHRIDLDLKKNELLRDNAFTAAEIARYDALIAKYQKEKADHINAKNLAAEEFKKNMLIWQKATAMAEYEYQRCLEWIKAAWEVMSPAERDLLDMAEARLATAKENLETRRIQYENANKEYLDALLFGDKEDGNEIESLARLEAELAQAEGKVRGENLKLAEEERLVGLAQDLVNVNWDAELKALEKKVQDAKVRRDSAENALVAFKVADAYQAAEDTIRMAVNALGYDKFTGGGYDDKAHKYNEYSLTAKAKSEIAESSLAGQLIKANKKYDDAVAAKMNIKEIKSAAFSEALREQLKNTKVTFKNVEGVDTPVDEAIFDKDGKLVVKADKYTQKEMNEDAKNGTTSAYPNRQKVYYTNLLNSLEKFSVDGNGIKWAETEKAGLLEEKKPIAEAYDAAKKAWQLVIDVYTGKTVNNVAAPKSFNDAVKAYNDAYAKLTKSAKDYNELYSTLYDQNYQTSVKDQQSKHYMTSFAAELFKTDGFFGPKGYLPGDASKQSLKGLWDGLKPEKQTLKQLEGWVASALMVDPKTTEGAAYVKDHPHATENDLNKAETIAQLEVENYYQKENLGTMGAYDKNNDGVNDHYVALVSAAHDFALGELEKAANKKDLDAAEKNVTDAITALNKAYTDLSTTGFSDFVKVAHDDYAQQLEAEQADILKAVTGDASKAYAAKSPATDKGGVKVDVKTKEVVANKASWNLNAKRTVINTEDLAKLMKTERLKMSDVKVIVGAKSKVAFGELAWQPEVNEYRFVEPTTADIDKYLSDVKADTKVLQDAELKNNLGAFGKLEWINREIAYCESMMGVEADVTPAIETVKALLAELDAQVTANYATLIEPKLNAKLAAEAAEKEGKKAVAAAEKARKALVKEQEANIEALAYDVTALKAVLADLRAQLAPFTDKDFNQPQYAANFLEFWKQKVEETKIDIAKLQETVIRIQKEIELNKAGNTNDAARIERKKQELEVAKQMFEAAGKDYNEMLQEFHNLIDNLAAARK